MAGNTSKDIDDLIPTRQSLLSRLKNWEDQASWQAFFNAYCQLIYNTALRARLTPTEAEEVVQETVIAVSKNIKGFKYDPARGSFKGWLLTQTRWQIADQFRKRQSHRLGELPSLPNQDPHAAFEMVPDPQGPELEALWDREWESNLFEAALERLKQKVDSRHYQVFELLVVRQWPVKKVAETLKMTAGYVYLIKHRLTVAFKKELAYLTRHGI